MSQLTFKLYSYCCDLQDLINFELNWVKSDSVMTLWNFILIKRFLFQEFDDPRDADDAVYELNGKELLGEK